MLGVFFNTYVKMFFLLSPFFSVSMFLAMTPDLNHTEKNRIARRTSLAILVCVIIFFFFGVQIFSVLGITLAAFQIGAGALLFRNAISLVSGKKGENVYSDDEDFAVVPLALPLIVGPGTIGTLLVMGADISDMKEKMTAFAAILLAVITVGGFLFMAVPIEKFMGKKILSALTKLTGLVLTALAAQIVFTGIKTFLDL